MEKTDRRIKRTQKLLQEALVSLTLEKGYDSVTIRQITERADVGYATFFRHYSDKDALLADVLVAMKDEFIGLLQPHSTATDPERTGVLIFEYVYNNADLCRVLLNSTETMALLRPLQEMGMKENQELFDNVSADSIPPEVAIYHMMTSLMMMIRWWLENDMPYPPVRMGQIAAELIIKPVHRAV